MFNLFKKKENKDVEVIEKEEQTQYSLEEMEEIKSNLPKFKYHPNLANDDILTFNSGICNCCGKKVKVYIDLIYSKDEVDCICLDCVASGEAAHKFNGEFNDCLTEGEEVTDKDKNDELWYRTPGYLSWQQPEWIGCCKDYCAYLGRVGYDELNNLGIFDEVINRYNEMNDNEIDVEYAKENLRKDGFMQGYLFQCLHCKKYYIRIDFD